MRTNDNCLSGIFRKNIMKCFNVPFLYGCKTFAAFFRTGEISPSSLKPAVVPCADLPLAKTLIRFDRHSEVIRCCLNSILASLVRTAEKGIDVVAF